MRVGGAWHQQLQRGPAVAGSCLLAAPGQSPALRRSRSPHLAAPNDPPCARPPLPNASPPFFARFPAAVSPLLEDALMDRDLVHRQTACSVVQHMSLGVAGLGCEDALTHLLNYVFPNIFEISPHIIQVRVWRGCGASAAALLPAAAELQKSK